MEVRSAHPETFVLSDAPADYVALVPISSSASNSIARLVAASAIWFVGIVAGWPAAAAPAAEIDAVAEITTADGFHEPHADILRLYFAIFDRPPDLGGARFWIDQYDQGMHVREIARFMSHSPEFAELRGETSDDRYIAALYENVLDRAPDTEGFAFWTEGLATNRFDRLWVLQHFAASNEFVADHRFIGEDRAIAGPPLHRPVGDAGPIIAVSVEAEARLGLDLDLTRREIVAILGDPRGWTNPGTVRFQLVDDPSVADVRVRIASPSTVDARCRPLRTGGRLSCRNGNSLNINSDRWAGATAFWTAPVGEYRAYVINHEMGHYLGYGHQFCPAAGALAPVMQQQTKGLQGCSPNGWPFP